MAMQHSHEMQPSPVVWQVGKEFNSLPLLFLYIFLRLVYSNIPRERVHLEVLETVEAQLSVPYILLQYVLTGIKRGV